MRLNWMRLLLLSAVLLVLPCRLAHAGDLQLAEIQAAYFFNFIKFTTWPDPSPTNKPLAIRTLQSPEIAKVMHDAQEQNVHGRTLDIRNCESLAELAEADAIFLPAKIASGLSADSWSKFGPTTLVVSDWDQSLTKGATIQLATVNGKLRFAINLRYAKALNISSRLLSLASEVQNQ